MHKDTIVNIVGVLVLLAAGGLGFYLYQKTQTTEKSLPDTASATVIKLGNDATRLDNTAPATTDTNNQSKTMNHVTIDTNFGKIVLELFRGDAPKAAENFATLAAKGFYNNLMFHRVIAGFMIQGGDPQGNGTGGPGYQFEDELNPNTQSYQVGYRKGVLAMANSGPNTNGSQFFIMLADYPLPHNYTIFGRVVSGQDVVDKIGAVKTGPGDRPLQPVVMKSVTVGE